MLLPAYVDLINHRFREMVVRWVRHGSGRGGELVGFGGERSNPRLPRC